MSRKRKFINAESRLVVYLGPRVGPGMTENEHEKSFWGGQNWIMVMVTYVYKFIGNH
jgi:hypothetical protein